MCWLEGTAFLCLYNAQRILSAIAKFLVHLLQEAEEQGRNGRKRRRKGRGEKGREGECRKK